MGTEGVEAADGGAVDEAGGDVVELEGVSWGVDLGLGWVWCVADLDEVVDGGDLLVRSGSCESGAGDERGEDGSEGLHCVVELVVKNVGIN